MWKYTWIVYKDTFDKALNNLERVLIRCETHNLSLSYEKNYVISRKYYFGSSHISSRNQGRSEKDLGDQAYDYSRKLN